MKIDGGSDNFPDAPEEQAATQRDWENFSTAGAGGGLPPSPPTAASIKDIGPFTDTATSQSALDREAQEADNGVILSPFKASLRRLGRDKRAMISIAIIVLMILIGFVGPSVYLHIGPTIQGGITGTKSVGPEQYHIYTHQELTFTDNKSTAAFPLGTDALGRDILARIMAGITVSIEVAFFVVIFDVVLGLVIGTLAGYYGGWIDQFLARFTDLMFAFPQLLFAILAAATLGPAFIAKLGFSGRLVLVSLALGITIWPQMARYVRGQTLQLKEQQFIEAARTVGTSNFGIIMRHIVPNLFNIVITAATLDIVGIIIAEATISLLGLGVQPPGSSLGLMIYDGSLRIGIQATEVIWPTIALAILVLCFSFVGDGVADAFNPRSKD